MTLELDATRVDEFVSLERGEVDRRIFSDEEIFEQEMDLIFARAWQFLCHESQIPKAGDFFETPVGRDNVLTVRQKDGSIKAMLNTCTHRGNAVCRAEEGNTKAFMCTYHGWSFDLAGNLIGVPGADQFYKGDLDKSKYGLQQVAQMDIYNGFVFATMDETAPPLTEFLGAVGRLSIDLLACRDIEIIPGIQKFVIDCNWKFAVDNLFDYYHPPVTHMSAMDSGIFPKDPDVLMDIGGAVNTLGDDLDIPSGVSGDGLHELVLLSEFGHAVGGPSTDQKLNPLIDNTWRQRPGVPELLGPVGIRVSGHPNVFPNLWFTELLQVSLRVPVSAHKTEIWWFSFTEKGYTPEAHAQQVMLCNHIFGPAGLLEQEDGENWAQSTLQTRGARSMRIPQALVMDLGRGKVIKEHGIARVETTTNEHAQLWTYHAWAQWMKGLEWDALKKATTPPDVV